MMKEIQKIEGKKYALNNSYFKNRKPCHPDTILEIVKYKHRYGELPFECRDTNWLYEAAIERQKRCGVQNSQYLTPEKTAAQLAGLTDSFEPEGNLVLDACCGTGQLTKYLQENKFNVTGFDNDPDMVEICKLTYPQAKFEQYDFRDQESERQYGLVVSNPPHEQKDLGLFFNWLSRALTDTGKAVLLLPKGFIDKDRPKELAGYLKRFDTLHREDMKESFAHTKWICEICIVGLTDTYKEERRIKQNAVLPLQVIDKNDNIDNNNDNNRNNKPIEGQLMEAEKIFLVGLDRISPNPENSRKKFVPEELDELVKSIRQHGLLQPVTLRPKGDGYEIVYGERRYRAFKLNGEETIPAVIRDYTDEQVLEITLVENINRRDLGLLEESDAYRKLTDTRGYSIEDLCRISGKGEGYIRQRLRLQHLTEDFRRLLEEEAISPGIAFETAKYAGKLQQRIFREHFTGDDESSWRHLGVKQYAGHIARLYSNGLSGFSFDKGECGKCNFNAALYELFPGKEGRCMNSECLENKKSRFTENFCKAVSERYPGMEVCVSPYDRISEEMSASLRQAGIEVKTLDVQPFPEKPQAPLNTDFATVEEYESACADFAIEEPAYYKELEEIEEKVKSGLYRKVAYVGDNNPVVAYARVTEKPSLSPAQALMKQDSDNKQAAGRNAARDAGALLQAEGFSPGALSVFEDELLLYAMLEGLDVKYFPLLGIEENTPQPLSEQQRYKLMKSLSAEQKALVCRSFLLRYLAGAYNGGAYGAMLLVELSRQHHPQRTDEIVRRHSESYNKKYLRLHRQLEALEPQGQQEERLQPAGNC